MVFVDHENRRTTYTDPRLAFAVEEKDHVFDYRQRFDGSSTALQVCIIFISNFLCFVRNVKRLKLDQLNIVRFYTEEI